MIGIEPNYIKAEYLGDEVYFIHLTPIDIRDPHGYTIVQVL